MTSNSTPVRCILCQRSLRHSGDDFTGKQIYRCDECDYVMTPANARESASELYNDPDYFDGWGCNMDFHYQRFEPAVHRQVEQYLAFMKQHTSGKSLLDVGTGSGLFPHRARLSGYEVEATDLSQHVSETLPTKAGFALHQGTIEEIKFERSYDIITMLHVLEHTRDPLSTMRRAREILSERGYLLVVVPNYRSFDTRVKNLLSKFKLKSRPYKHLALGHHNYVFSVNSLKVLGRAANLRIVHHTTTQPAWRSGPWQRMLEPLEMAAWCWVVYQKPPAT